MVSNKEKMICVGRVGAPVGIKGHVRFITQMQQEELLYRSPLFYGTAYEKQCHLTRIGMQKGVLVVAISGVQSRTDAETWRHVDLYLFESAFPAIADPDEYYVAELVGLQVVTQTGDPMGEVIAVHNFGAGDIIEIRHLDGKEEMLLFDGHNFPEIDREKQQIICNPPEIMLVGDEDSL